MLTSFVDFLVFLYFFFLFCWNMVCDFSFFYISSILQRLVVYSVLFPFLNVDQSSPLSFRSLSISDLDLSVWLALVVVDVCLHNKIYFWSGFISFLPQAMTCFFCILLPGFPLLYTRFCIFMCIPDDKTFNFSFTFSISVVRVCLHLLYIDCLI